MRRSPFVVSLFLVFLFGSSLGSQVVAGSSRKSLAETNDLAQCDLSYAEELIAEYEKKASESIVGTSPALDVSILLLPGLFVLSVVVPPKDSKRVFSRERLIWLILVVLVALGGFLAGKVFEEISTRNAYPEGVPATTFYEVVSYGASYWAVRFDGRLVYGGSSNAGGINGTNAVAVINSALNNLTIGRTRQEKVSLRGRFECKDSLSIRIPSNTILDLSEAEVVDARLPDDGGKGSDQIIENADLKGNTRITIIGGLIDGQRGNYSSVNTGEGDGIRLVNCTDSVVQQTHVKSASRSGLMTISCQYSSFVDVVAEDCGGFGQIEQTGDRDCVWVRCIAKDSSASGSGFNWCTLAERLSFFGCEAINNSLGEGFSSSNTIEGRIRFYECEAEFNGQHGFKLHYGETLYNCVARDNGQLSALDYDGFTTDGSISPSTEGVVVMGGASYDDQVTKTQRYGLNLNNANSLAIGVDCTGNGDESYDIVWFAGVVARNAVSMCKGRMQYQGYFSPQPSLPLSGIPKLNAYGVLCMVFVSGGNVSDVSINGQSIGLTSGSFLVNPHDNITIVYVEAPSWKWFAYGNMNL